MSVIGIISEYNPFHHGHLYHLDQAKNEINPAGVICIMSGNFVQRGGPALVNKWSRAEMALASGVDLVLELPVLYATRSAYWFARGGIESLYRTKVVTHLAFGVENDDAGKLTRAARHLTFETADFRRNLKDGLEKGYSFPRARARALSLELPTSASLWSNPNNILGLTYLQVLQELCIPMEPVLIKRKGSGYLEQCLNNSLLPSATAIRNTLRKRPGLYLQTLPEIKEFLPQASFEILYREFSQGRGPVFLENMAPQVITLLRRSTKKDLQQIIDVSEGLENRLLKAAQETADLNDFLQLVKMKRFTYTRLQRFLVHLLLNYTIERESFLSNGPPYLRVLGFTSRGRELLRQIKSKTSLPLITKGAHSRKHCCHSEIYRAYWEMDVLATNLYALLLPSENERKGNLDYLRGPVYH